MKHEIELNWTLKYDPEDLIYEIFTHATNARIGTTALAFKLFKAIDKENLTHEDNPFEFLDKVEKYIKSEKNRFKRERNNR